jgi:hypothetical protein
MAEAFDEDSARSSAGDLAARIAMSGEASEEAREYLRKQSRLTDLQIENLQKLDAFEASHLRWRRFDDQMRGAMQIMLVVIAAVAVVAVGAALWSASRAEGLVVDSFSVPPQFAQSGVSGEIIADDLTNRVAAVRDFANEHSIARSEGVKNERDEEIKVDIPDTGISLSEVSRYLRSWLGHERHLSGNLRNIADGKIALTVALDGTDATTFSGPADGLEKLEQRAAEHVFQSVDPSNYVLYLSGMRRDDESLSASVHLIRVADSPGMLSDGYSLWSNRTGGVTGDLTLTLKRAGIAAEIDPKELAPHMEIMFASEDIGHDEAALREARSMPRFRQEDQFAWREGPGFAQVLEQGAIASDVYAGDFDHAQHDTCGWCSFTDLLLSEAEYAARMHDVARSRALIGKALAAEGANPSDVNRSRYFADASAGDWPVAVADARGYGTTIEAPNAKLRTQKTKTHASPLLAVALARAGDFAQAHAEIDTTPGDCVACETARANIDALEGNIAGATYWFARATRDAPSIPFAYTDWGAMLLHKGEYDAAIAKFEIANKKGPHFADPLEMWGEALMLENRSDLALDKFEEANRYAPSWGRLHLKWGEALFYAGEKDEAEKQFAIAAALDLSPPDRPALLQWMTRHG